MAKAPVPAVLFLILLPVGVGTAILGTYTVGASLNQHEPAWIGIALALLVVALLGWFLFFSEPPKSPDWRFGSILVGCGTLCILFALAVQIHLASLVAENSRQVAVILRERGGNVNLNMNIPETVKAISYLALFAGIGVVAFGVRIALPREGPTRPVRDWDGPPTRQSSTDPKETGFRAD
jgi:hypothetical protein